MTANEPVLSELTADGYLRAAHTDPAWDRAHHDVASSRGWGLRDGIAAAEVREYTQGEASGDRPPSPPGPGATEAGRYFGTAVGHWATARHIPDRLLPGQMYEAASQEPAISRGVREGADDYGLAWSDYLRSAAIRQATQGEGDAAPAHLAVLDTDMEA